MNRFPHPVQMMAAFVFSLFVYVAVASPMAFLIDDAYYSLTVSANIAAGNGITYGGFPTNGFQPLYSFLLTPIFALFGAHRLLCLKLALIFCGLCQSGALLLLYRIAHRYAGYSAGVAAVAIGALSTNLMTHSAGGLETSLNAFVFLAVVDFYTARRKNLSIRSALILGLLLGLLAYSRLDACFVFVAVALDRFVVSGKKPMEAIVRNLLIFVPALALLAPWFIWNQATFGFVTQSSGAFHHWRGVTTQVVTYGLPGFLFFAAIKLASLAVKLPLEPLMGYRALVLGPAQLFLGTTKLHRNFLILLWEKHPAMAVLLVGLGIALLIALIKYGRAGLTRIKTLRPLSWELWALLGAACYYPLYQINYSMRHFFAYSMLLAAPLGAFLVGLLRIDKDGPLLADWKNAVFFALLVIVLFRCGPFDPRLPKSNPYGFDRISEIRATIPKGASVGYTDCGFYGYFLPDYFVVNLDGIMNFKALEAMKTNQMSRYLVDEKVGYVLALDNLHNEYRTQFESDMLSVLEKVKGSDFIYRVKAPGSPPG